MKCIECQWSPALRKDPRDPPLDTRVCLCDECYTTAAEDVIEELEGRIAELRSSTC
jgi:hypothetical protein